MKLVYIHNLSVYWETGCVQGKKVRGNNCDFCDFFFPQQFFVWLIFQPCWKCNYGSFLHFKHSTLFTAWVFFEFVGRNYKILVQLSALFRKISPPLRPLSYRNQSIDLLFKSMDCFPDWFLYDNGLRHERVNVTQYFDFLIFMTFNSNDLSFKSHKKTFVNFLKFSSLDIFFNVLKTNFIIGVN